MIYKYDLFILESNYNKCIEEAGTIGRWIENKVKDNDYLKSIISPFLVSTDPDIRTANAIEFLSDFDKKQIFNMVWNHINRKVESVQTEAVQGGKMIFKSFLKSLNSVSNGKFNKVPNKNFIIFYETHSMNDDILLSAFNRFQSLLHLYSSTISNQECKAYFGIDSNLNLVYGVVTVLGDTILGSFKINKSSLEWLKLLNSNRFADFKRDILEMNIEDIYLLQKILKFMQLYPLGDKKGFEPIFNNGIFSLSYYGVSKWDNGSIDSMEYENIKTNLKTKLSTESWSSRILLNLSAENFYLRISFKLK